MNVGSIPTNTTMNEEMYNNLVEKFVALDNNVKEKYWNESNADTFEQLIAYLNEILYN